MQLNVVLLVVTSSECSFAHWKALSTCVATFAYQLHPAKDDLDCDDADELYGERGVEAAGGPSAPARQDASVGVSQAGSCEHLPPPHCILSSAPVPCHCTSKHYMQSHAACNHISWAE